MRILGPMSDDHGLADVKGASLESLATPTVLVDLDRMDQNLDRMMSYATAHGLALRPHIKTHKAPVVAQEQVARGARGLTCATPKELEVMATVCTDLLLAYPPVGAARLERLMGLPSPVRLGVAVDSLAAVDGLADAARRAGRSVDVYVEFDVGLHRVGVSTSDEAVALARRIAERPPLAYAGVFFFPGRIRDPLDVGNASLMALSSRVDAVVCGLERAGLRPAVVSGGSTPTAWRAHDVAHVTEMRPGTYVYNDRGTVASGACAWQDCALTVLATVVSTAVPGQAVLDTGTKALGRDPVQGAAGEGYGQLLEHPEVVVSRMWEEHGVVDLSRSDWRPVVGERVRVVPNHVCIVTHLFDTVYGVRADALETSWPIAARGREA